MPRSAGWGISRKMEDGVIGPFPPCLLKVKAIREREPEHRHLATEMLGSAGRDRDGQFMGLENDAALGSHLMAWSDQTQRWQGAWRADLQADA